MYAIRDLLERWFDIRNKRARAINLTAVIGLSIGLAFVALPVQDTTAHPVPQEIQEQKTETPRVSFEEKQAKRLAVCEEELEEAAVQCRIQKTKNSCNAWMDLSKKCSAYR